MPSELLLVIFLYKYIYNLNFLETSCDVNFGKKTKTTKKKEYPTCSVSWHCTEINSHIGLEMLNLIFFSICTGVTHCIKYVWSYLHGFDYRTNKVFSK